MLIFIRKLMEYHFWIILKIIDKIGQHTYIVWTDSELEEIWEITCLMEKNSCK